MIPHFVVSFYRIAHRAFSSLRSENRILQPSPQHPQANAAAGPNVAGAAPSAGSIGSSRAQQIRSFFFLEDSHLSESDYALKIISDEEVQVRQFVDISEEKECPICLGTLYLSVKSENSKTSDAASPKKEENPSPTTSLTNRSSQASSSAPASSGAAATSVSSGVEEGEELLPPSPTAQQQDALHLLANRKIALCPHSRSRGGKYLHGMCLACAQQLFTTTHSSELCDCPSCRKPISLVLTDDFTEDSAHGKVYAEERRREYLSLVLYTVAAPVACAKFVGPPNSFRIEISRALLGELLYTPLLITVGATLFFTGWFLSSRFISSLNWLSSKKKRTDYPDQSNDRSQQQQQQQQQQQEIEAASQVLSEEESEPLLVSNSNKDRISFLFGLVFGLLGGIVLPTKLLNKLSGGAPRARLLQQVSMDLMGTTTIFASKTICREMLRKKCFSRPRSQLARSKRRLENLAQLTSIATRIAAPLLSIVIYDILQTLV